MEYRKGPVTGGVVDKIGIHLGRDINKTDLCGHPRVMVSILDGEDVFHSVLVGFESQNKHIPTGRVLNVSG